MRIFLTCLTITISTVLLAGCGPSEPNKKLIVLEKKTDKGGKDTGTCVADTLNKETYAQVEKCAQDFEKKGFDRVKSE